VSVALGLSWCPFGGIPALAHGPESMPDRRRSMLADGIVYSAQGNQPLTSPFAHPIRTKGPVHAMFFRRGSLCAE
jgi:hypothetical protein